MHPVRAIKQSIYLDVYDLCTVVHFRPMGSFQGV
jgi:hypothetical protein